MGTSCTKETRKEEVIIAQNGAGNSANPSQVESTKIAIYLTTAVLIIVAIIFAYALWKKLHKKLTKKIERQTVAAIMRNKAARQAEEVV